MICPDSSSPGSDVKPLSRVAVRGYPGLFLHHQPTCDSGKLNLSPVLQESSTG